MELLETQDPEKKKLIEATDRHKHELEKEVKAISERTERIAKNALIIGGALAITYLIVQQIGTSKKKKKKQKIRTAQETEPVAQSFENTETTYEPPSLLTQLADRLVTQATVVLLDLAKDKLAEYLSSRSEKVEEK